MSVNALTPRLVVTIGPSSMGLGEELAGAGAEAFRLNASHMDAIRLRNALEALNRAAPTTPVIVDLQGAKMRLGKFETREIEAGDTLEVVLGDRAVGSAVPLPHPEPFSAVGIGDLVTLDDGRLSATVARVGATTMSLVLQTAGVLRPRKGFNRSEHPIRLSRLTQTDEDLARLALGMGCSDFAFSFTSDGRECAWLRQLAPNVRVAAKIERADALSSIQTIATAADALWICRGDLGAQVGALELGGYVAAINPRHLKCPTLMAGQVLEHLTEHTSPTRSELCHVTDLGTRGYAGIVLSDETAIGKDPVSATRWAAQLVARAFRSGSAVEQH